MRNVSLHILTQRTTKRWGPPFYGILLLALGGGAACRPAIDDNAPDPEATSSSTPADGSITTAMLANGAVTPAKLSQAYLPLAGGTMSGALVLSGAPSAALHASTKSYSDSYLGGQAIDTSALSSITNNQVLGWSAATSKWAPLTVVGAADATAIQGVNVSNVAPTSNQLFYYDNGTSKWTAGSALTTNGQILVGKTGAVPQVVTMSGDATIDNAGAVTIANTTVTGAKIANQTITDTKISGITAGCASGQTLKSDGAAGFYCGHTNGNRVTQVAHGFVVGDVLYLNGSTYTKAISTAVGTLGVFVVSAAVSANVFEIVQAGYVSGLAGMVAGTYYYVSAATAGAMTSTEPTASGSYSNPIFVADSVTSGYVLPYRPLQKSEKLIYSNSMTVAATSVTISGLDGDTDLTYRLRLKIVNDANISGLGYTAQPNGDSTGANYVGRNLTGYSAGAAMGLTTGTPGFYIGYSSHSGTAAGGCGVGCGGAMINSETIIHAKSGTVRSSTSTHIDFNQVDSMNYIEMNGSMWINKVTNITSLVLTCGGTVDCFGVGSRIELYTTR